MLVKDNGGADFEPAPAGLHKAICCQVIDLGSQPSQWGAKPKVLLGWELPECLRTIKIDGEERQESFLVWKQYTVSLSERANLRADLQSWRGVPFTAEELQGFDLRAILDKACQLNIVHQTKEDKTFANIGSIVPLSKEQLVPKRTKEIVYFSISEWEESVFETFSENLRNKILQTKEAKLALGQVDDAKYSEAVTSQAPQSTPAEDIPFLWMVPFITGGLGCAIENLLSM